MVIWPLDASGNISNERCTDEACYERNTTPRHFEEVTDYHHKRDFDVPAETKTPGWYSLSRNLNLCWVCGEEHPAGWGSITEMLRHAAGGPAPEILGKDGWRTPDGKPIDDLQEPIYVVKSCEAGRELAAGLHLVERWQAGKISRWYFENCFYVCDAATREWVMDAKLTETTVTGALAWKPVVITFADAELERKLAQVCTQVVTVLPTVGQDYLELVRQCGPKKIKEAVAIVSDDLPVECLDGWLGDICRTRMADYPLAYAWPALLTAASVLVTKSLMPDWRANVFTGLIGPVGSGKTCAFNEAFRLLGLKDKPLAQVADTEVVRLKSGSGEGMAQKLGDQNGDSKLVFVDELEHLMKKVNIKGSTFANTLDDAYTTDAQMTTVEHRKEVPLNVRLSLAGGVPEQGFSEIFGAGTVGGLHSRFMFGVCPNSYPGYCWVPPQGGPVLDRDATDEFSVTARPSRIEIDQSVWAEKIRWQRELKLHGRAVEIALKAATIAACFDNRGTLTADQLGPALAFARYQDAGHRRFEPNPGKNDDACLESDITKYMQDRAADGHWINRRKMLKEVNAHRYGSGVTNRVLAAMSASMVIELGKDGRELVIRLVLKRQ